MALNQRVGEHRVADHKLWHRKYETDAASIEKGGPSVFIDFDELGAKSLEDQVQVHAPLTDVKENNVVGVRVGFVHCLVSEHVHGGRPFWTSRACFARNL